MAMRFQWLTRKKRGVGTGAGASRRRPIQLLCLEERNSASALYGIEGLVLFSAGNQAVTTRVHRPLGDDPTDSSFLPAIITETPESGEENQATDFSQKQRSKRDKESHSERSQKLAQSRALENAWEKAEFAASADEPHSKAGLLDRIYASDKRWFDGTESTGEDEDTKLWNSFRDQSLLAIKSGKAGSERASVGVWGFIGSDSVGGSDPLVPGQGFSVALATSGLISSWASSFPSSAVPGGSSSGTSSLESGSLSLGTSPDGISSGPAQDETTHLQPSQQNGEQKGAEQPDSTENAGTSSDVDATTTKLEIHPEKNVTIGPDASGSAPSQVQIAAAFPPPAVNVAPSIGAGGTGFAQSIGVAPGGSGFSATGINGRMDGAPARVSVAAAPADLASVSISAGFNRGDAAASSGHGESASGALESQSVLFRINRGSGAAQDLQVRYTLKTFDHGSARTVERTAFLPAGQNQLLVTAGEELQGTTAEVATLSVASGPGYQASNGIATRMAASGGVSDAALLEAYRMGGSQDAFDTLVRQYWPGVFRTCHRILGQWADAEDVSQFVFLALTQMQLRFPPPLSRWLNRVARNASIGLLRSKKRRERREQIAARGDLTDSKEAAYMNAEVIETALEQLPDPLREAVSLRYLDGWSQQEAAQIIGCPRGTLSQRAAHGITRLRTMLTRDSA